jgi:four helix bundle protein
MAKILRFEDLEVWQLARSMAGEIFTLTNEGTFSRDFELKNQINRASGSVMDNLAEGFGRMNRAEFVVFISYSMGSCTEVKSQLYRSIDRNHISHECFEDLYNKADRISKMLFGLMNSTKASAVRGLRYKPNIEPNGL